MCWMFPPAAAGAAEPVDPPHATPERGTVSKGPAQWYPAPLALFLSDSLSSDLLCSFSVESELCNNLLFSAGWKQAC